MGINQQNIFEEPGSILLLMFCTEIMSTSNPNENISNEEDSFSVSDLRSPRQANISLSFSSAGTTTSSVLDYSDDNLSLPISPTETEASNEQNEGTCSVTPNGNSAQTTEEEPPTTRSEEVVLETEIAKESKEEKATSDAVKSIALLITRGAEVNTRDKQLRTPLHIACENVDSDSHHDCVSLLLDKGAEVNMTDRYGRTPLHISATLGCSTCINLLLNHGAKTDVKTREGDTALHECIHQVLSPPHEKKKGDNDDNVRDAEVDSHSSVESCPSLLFDHDDSINNMAESSFYQSPRAYHTIETEQRLDKTILPYNSLVGKSSSSQQLGNNDSFVTARSLSGSAWVKNQYYKSDDTNIIEEEEERSSSSFESVSTEGSLSSQADDEEDDDAPYIPWIFQGIEFVLHLVWYFLNSTLVWLSKALGRQERLNAAGYLSVQPPRHVKQAMDDMRRCRQKLE